MTTYIKLYGLPRSCTNLVNLLFQKHFSDVTILSNVMGWKHGNHPDNVDWSGKGWVSLKNPSGRNPLEFTDKIEIENIKRAYDEGKMNYVICMKDPYSWLISYSKYDARKSFISRAIVSRTHFNRKKLTEYISLWNDRHRNWLKLVNSNPNATTIKYEDILKDSSSALRKISDFFNLDSVANVDVPELILERNPESVGSMPKLKDKAFSKHDFYINKEYLKYYNQGDLKIIRNTLDYALVSQIGYEII